MGARKPVMPMHMRRAFHEAGHAYAAYHYNVGIEHVSLSAPAAGAISSRFQRMESYCRLDARCSCRSREARTVYNFSLGRIGCRDGGHRAPLPTQRRNRQHSGDFGRSGLSTPGTIRSPALMQPTLRSSRGCRVSAPTTLQKNNAGSGPARANCWNAATAGRVLNALRFDCKLATG